METRAAIRAGGLFGLGAAAGVVMALARRKAPRRALETVAAVDLQRYLGTWYEIARLPTWFERGCVGSTATYSLDDDGRLQVVNRCFARSFQGKLYEVKGRARVVDPESNAKLRVNFGPIGGDYWILRLGPGYEYALVGEPGRRNLWILSRTPSLDPATYRDLVETAKLRGFDTDRLVRTPQPAMG